VSWRGRASEANEAITLVRSGEGRGEEREHGESYICVFVLACIFCDRYDNQCTTWYIIGTNKQITTIVRAAT